MQRRLFSSGFCNGIQTVSQVTARGQQLYKFLFLYFHFLSKLEREGERLQGWHCGVVGIATLWSVPHWSTCNPALCQWSRKQWNMAQVLRPVIAKRET